MGDTPASSPWKAHLALWGVGLIYAYNYLVAKGLMQPERGAIVTPGVATAVAGLARRVPVSVDRVDYQVIPPLP